MDKITVHCMVRNEPFVIYAVRSVYHWVDKILLYDTGSYDEHTMEDTRTLRLEDEQGKITFKNVPIEVDETKWTAKADENNYNRMRARTIGKKGKWYCRKIMIDHTDTEYFMILDGDEVHYVDTMKRIRWYLDHWPEKKVCGFLPLVWFTDMGHVFQFSRSGRVFKTMDVSITNRSPSEIHTVKATGKNIGHNSLESFTMTEVLPYAHFESYLKPWRRNIQASKIKSFMGTLPEVMQDDDTYIRRFQNESCHRPA